MTPTKTPPKTHRWLEPRSREQRLAALIQLGKPRQGKLAGRKPKAA